MMKRLFIILTALVLIMGMTACGGINQSAETGFPPPDSNQQKETEAENTNSENVNSENTNSEQDGQDSTIQSASDGAQIQTNTPDSEIENLETEVETEDMIMRMNVQIGNTSFTATLEDNAATSELIEMMREAPISISMNDYSGFEKVGPLGRSLTTDNHQTTTSAGDIVLYSGNQIVMFYGSNSWSYTRIGKIDDLTGWEDALGSGSITAVFSLVE